MFRIVLITSLLISFNFSFAQSRALKKEINAIIQDNQATVGVAIMCNGHNVLTINNQHHYPLMSVFKFHLALCVLDHLDKNSLPLDSEILIRKSDLLTDTYSPLRDERPDGGFNMSIRELLRYSVSKSDNNACDILLRYVGGAKTVERYIKSIGIKNIAISATEEVMHEHPKNQYLNWTTPLAAVQLLDIFLKKELFSIVYQEFLEKTLIETITGTDKIKALLPPEVIVGHKTGNSSREDGLKIGDNDIAFIRLPNGKGYTIAIFVMNSREDDKTNASIIARISKVTYDYLK